jgi:hypothetical protein
MGISANLCPAGIAWLSVMLAVPAHRLARFERAQGHGHIVARGDLQGIGQGGASVSGASVMPV